MNMSDAGHFDFLIIGGGQAGIPLAYGLAKAGKRVGLVEGKNLGGSCINFGCTPTKAAIASARLAYQARKASEYGLNIPSVEVDFAAVLKRAKDILMQSRTSLDRGFERVDNPALIRGHAALDAKEGKRFAVKVGAARLTADQVVLDTGTRTAIPAVPGLKRVDNIDSENWLEKTDLPDRLIMIGAGYIGLEMGQFYRRMGCKVTVIEGSGQIIGHEDHDVAAAIQGFLESDGVEFRMNTRVKNVRPSRDGVVVLVDGLAGQSEIEGSHIFLATGRKPNTDKLGLDKVGVKVNQGGIVEVDKRLSTNVPGIWAAGDIRGGPMFTHTSWDDYRILMSQILGDGSRTTDRIIPYGVFVDPELGRVGMTEKEARASGAEIKVSTFEMAKNGKANEIGEPRGFIKVVADAATNRILGAAVLAVEGAELVHMYVDIMTAGAPFTAIKDAIHIHPTLAEAVQSAVSSM
jgi:pyruvate/2-oxoglutarate dehydrogenase complex dihydrolipoamide dehydrogenase (E3) component